MELQAAVGSGEKVVKGKAECESLASHVDIDGNGMISFIEFLVGFGLSDDGASQPAAAKEALAASQAKKPDIVQGVCRNAARSTSASTASHAPSHTSTSRATAGSTPRTLSRPSSS